jgi:hypothetical protein
MRLDESTCATDDDGIERPDPRRIRRLLVVTARQSAIETPRGRVTFAYYASCRVRCDASSVSRGGRTSHMFAVPHVMYHTYYYY